MQWPDKKRIAVLLSFDIDGETLWLTRNPINRQHLTNLSRGRYATKQGLPRILRMLEEESWGVVNEDHLLPVSLFISSLAIS